MSTVIIDLLEGLLVDLPAMLGLPSTTEMGNVAGTVSVAKSALVSGSLGRKPSVKMTWATLSPAEE